MDVPWIKHTLANGLDVIVHEDEAAPVVAVSVWYHVGSKNERSGRTGLAHLVEHLMFEGAAHQPDGYFLPLQRAGGALNGSTNADRTNYWEVVPRGAAELALWMEADRMGWLRPALSEARFATQRDVVLNERRQNYENRPYGLAPFALLEAIYPPGHPYRWPTIGLTADLTAASLGDVEAFLEAYYHPANASLAIAGAVRAERALRLAERLFGPIPAGSAPAAAPAPAVTAAPRRLVLEDRVELPRLYVAWPSPALFADGDAELDLVADLMASGRTARLYRRLIHDRRVATELAASQTSREAGGLFQIVATAAPDRTLAEIDAAVAEEVDRLAASGPTAAEIERGRAQAESGFVLRTETLGGFGGKADQLNAYNTYLGTPAGFATDLGRYLAATPAALTAAAGRWLRPEAAVRLSVVPEGRVDLALPDSTPAGGGP